MLNIETSFPHAGSKAIFDGFLWRIIRRNADGTATISRDGPGSSFLRNAPSEELIDPASAIAQRPDADLALRLAVALKNHEVIRLSDVLDLARDIHDQRLCRTRPTPSTVRAILVALGWHQKRTANLRTIYVRQSTTYDEGAAS